MLMSSYISVVCEEKMDAIEFNVAKNNLKNVKSLLSQFIGLSNHITELHNSITLQNGPNEVLESDATSKKLQLDSGIQKDFEGGAVNSNICTLNSGIQNDFEGGTVSTNICTLDSAIQKYYEGGTVNINICTLDSGLQKDFEGGTVSTMSLPADVVFYCDDQNNIDYNGTRLDSDDGSHLNDTQVMSLSTSLEVPNDYTGSLVLDLDDGSYLNDKSSTNLYFHHLYDGTDPCALLDHSFDSFIGNKIGGLEIMEVDQNYPDIGGESSDHVALTVGMLCTANEIASSGMNEVIVERQHNYSETEVELSSCTTLTVGTTYQSKSSNADVDVETQQTSLNANYDPFQITELSRRHGCDNQKMHVPTSDQGAKKLCCIFCLKRVSKFARHITTVHKDKEEVKQLQGLPVGSRERWKCIDKIKKMGQFEWNRNAEINGGELSTSRRPNKKSKIDATGFYSCPNCLGSFGALRQHWNNCTGNPLPGERIVKQLSRITEKRLHVDACKELEDIIASMHQDEEVLCIRFDWIVVTFANDLCENLKKVFHHQLIRDKWRSCGKLLLASRLICAEVNDFASLFTVQNVNTVIGAIRSVAHFDPVEKTFNSPGTASNLVTLVNTIGYLLKTEYMKLEYEDKENAVVRFLAVFERDARKKINRIVAVDIINARRWKPLNIPSTEDVGKLAAYLDHERVECYNQLTQQYSEDTWTKLAKLTMMSILIFNRKRVGDVQNILVIEFNRREIIKESSDSLPEKNENMIKSRIAIRGKLYRTVPVLLKHNVDECLELLLRYRKKAGVPDKNEFLFGIPSKCEKIKTLKGCILLKTYSELCGAQNPSSLRGTNLRKHFASVVGTLGLPDNDVTNVANFMGHSDKIHRDVYRHNPIQREVHQMSNLLEVAQGKSNSTFEQVTVSITANDTGSSIVKAGTKRKKKESITANDTGSSTVEAGTKRKKKEIVAIKKPQKRKQVVTRSNDKTKIVKRTIVSKP